VRGLRLALLALGIGFGVAVEWAFYNPELGLALAIADLVVGCVLLICGAVAWERRRDSHVGALMSLAGLTWFAGTIGGATLFWHRGPLVHLHLSYPTGRLPTRLTQAVVAAAYVDALIEPLGSNDVLTLVLAAVVALTACQVFLGTSGPARKAGGPALAAALAFAAVLALGALNGLADLGISSRTVLWIYDTVIACVAVGLLVDLLRGRWTEAVVTGLVVDLGATSDAGTLRAKLARALGDPSLAVGYRLPETGAFVDDAGRPVTVPSTGSGRAATPIVVGGEEVAVLVHDEALLADRDLVDSVAAAARIALSNARLQAESRARAAELEASRRRIVEAADAQRRRLEQELREGPERRLATVAALVSGLDPQLEQALVDTRAELREFSRGVHPAVLTEGGLSAALAELASRSPVPVDVAASVDRLAPAIEAAAYFVCSEALANVAKHAKASHATVNVEARRGLLLVEISDDGIGGVDLGHGSGLRGLADRVEALGGRLTVESFPGPGTCVIAELPLEG
jgi:signal transduction histidine kinase